MSLISWSQTFRTPAKSLLTNAGVSVYLTGTSIAARVFDSNNTLKDVVPQVYTDSVGKTTIQLDTDDYSNAQLFDIFCTPDGVCISDENRVSLKSLMIFQDIEGGRNFKNIFAQTTMPATGMKDSDLWFDTDNNNETYRYNGTNWISVRDGTIATAANTANWSGIIDDDTHKPSNDADVTGDEGQDWDWLVGSKPDQDADKTGNNTANNTTYANGTINQTGNNFDVYGDLRMRNGTDISLYSPTNNYIGGLYAHGADNVFLESNGKLFLLGQTSITINTPNLLPASTHTTNLGSSMKRWDDLYIDNINCSSSFYRAYSSSGLLKLYHSTTGAFLSEYRYAFT